MTSPATLRVPPVRMVRMTGRASRFLQVVRDLGHLDDHGVEHVMLSLAEEAGSTRATTVDIAAVRRHVAARIFPDLGVPGAVLAEDWPLLFS